MEDRDEEIRRKRRLRAHRYAMSLPPEQRVLSDDTIRELKARGLVDENGLTPAGELKLHQLQLLDWMVKNERFKS